MKRVKLLLILVVIACFLAACSEPEAKVVEKEVTRVVKETVMETVVETVIVEGTLQTVEQQVTKVVEVEKIVTATPEPEPEPAIGGKLIFAQQEEPPTLDPHLAVSSGGVLDYLGATLVTMDPQGNYVPYLAESWEVSEDGLEWTFFLRQDVTFHDGAPLTAHDYAWTFERVRDPKTKAMAARAFLGPILKTEALDDYTLRISLYAPNSALLSGLDLGFMQPLSQAAVQEWGEQYGRHPVGVGPYKLKEWITGDRVILERNPDYNWGPEFVRQGPPYIETLEFRVIPDSATLLAGLEAGEIDYAELGPKDVQRIQALDQFQVFDWLFQGMTPGLFPNTSKPPFDDVKVRQAFGLAVDRETLIKVIVGEGNAAPQYGPISPSVSGYWPGVEYICHSYDLEKAKTLMEEAGYTYNGDGMLEKDGEPFKLELAFSPESYEYNVSVGEVLQQQFKALGVDVELGLYEWGVFIGKGIAGDVGMGLVGYQYWDMDVMYLFYRSGGGMNFSHYSNPELDEILDQMRATADPDERQEWSIEAQKHIIENAATIPLYTSKEFIVLSKRVMGEFPLLAISRLWLNDLYLEME